jgi:hypothetical protein
MSELDLDEIYNFTIKLARDVRIRVECGSQVPHFTPRSFHLSTYTHSPCDITSSSNRVANQMMERGTMLIY